MHATKNRPIVRLYDTTYVTYELDKNQLYRYWF